MPKILAFSSSLVTLTFSVHNIFETTVLLKIFDAECPYKLSYFEPLCLPAKMAAETVIRSIEYTYIVRIRMFVQWNLGLTICQGSVKIISLN